VKAESEKRLRAFCLFLPIVLVACSATAQMGGGGALTASVAENSRKLKQYTYKQTTQLYLGGELRKTQLAQVHYDSSGQRVVVPQDPPDEQQSQQPGRRRLGGRIIAKKIEEKKDEMKEYVERLVGLMGQYLPPNPDRLKAAAPKAQVSMSESGDAKIAMKDYLKPGDLMTLAVDPSNKQLNQIVINSWLDEDPASFVVNFARLKDGTNYPSLTTVQSTAKQLELRVTTSDYHK
jgi:hypothetical protein